VQQKELSILSETVISEGAFFLMGNNKLVWEYKSPYQYKIVINGDKILIDNSTSKMTFDARSNRIFQEISNIIIKSIDGRIVNDNSMFGTELFENSLELKASLKPKTKELGMLFKQINLYFKKSNYLVYKIEMLEIQGDRTVINLKNHKLNENIENKVFDIDN
jgi:outer membrane lipoprotein-sorting protein